MIATLIVAALLAGLSAVCLGLVDAGRELDDVLSRLQYETAALHRATSASVEHGAPVDPITRPRTALSRAVESLGTTADRIVRETSPPYGRLVAHPLAAALDLVPSAEGIDRALRDYLEQTEQSRAEATRSRSAGGLSGRLLDLNYEMLVQKISEARTRTREGIGRALVGVQVITLLSIGIAAFAVGRSTKKASSDPASYRRP